jgi:hypothetical protein
MQCISSQNANTGRNQDKQTNITQPKQHYQVTAGSARGILSGTGAVMRRPEEKKRTRIIKQNNKTHNVVMKTIR